MALPKPLIAKTEDHLRARVVRLLAGARRSTKRDNQSDFFSCEEAVDKRDQITTPTSSISEFLSYLCDATPTGGIYLFGGILRDLALFGRKGFASDIDLVVEGDWKHVIVHLKALGANQNRFGGFRLNVDGWPVDIWSACETWAIREGFVRYRGIESLTETTILNWDAILMDWRTKQVVARPKYFREIQSRVLDIVLVENPNPLGAAVRAFRHLCLKDARKITVPAATYLSDSARKFTPEAIIKAEAESYRESVINPAVLRFLEHVDTTSHDAIRQQFDSASRFLQPLLL
jgi:hypothetical protein